MSENSLILPFKKWWEDPRFLTAGEETALTFLSQLGLQKDEELLLYNLVSEAERAHEILCFIGGLIPSHELVSTSEKTLSDSGTFLLKIKTRLWLAYSTVLMTKKRFSHHSTVRDIVIRNINHSIEMLIDMLESILVEMKKRPPSDEVYE